MRDVKLVRLSDDGTHVVLTHEGTGEEFALRIDDRLRGFVVSDRARVGQLPLERPSRLAPKEIQARLRAGESSEDIAAAADVPLERILRYAGPVLAEREYIAEQAQRCALRRAPGEGPSRQLGPTVIGRLEDLGVAVDHTRWDAWRTPDGRWAIAVFYTPPEGAEQRALYSFDPLGRTVVPSDDPATWLVSDRVPDEPEGFDGDLGLGADGTRSRTVGPGPRTPREARPRLTAVPSAPRRAGGPQEDDVVRPIRPEPRPGHEEPAFEEPEVEREPAGEVDPIAYEDTVKLSRPFVRGSDPGAGGSGVGVGGAGATDGDGEPRIGPDELPDLGAAPADRPVVSVDPVRADRYRDVEPDALPGAFARTPEPTRERQPEPEPMLEPETLDLPLEDPTEPALEPALEREPEAGRAPNAPQVAETPEPFEPAAEPAAEPVEVREPERPAAREAERAVAPKPGPPPKGTPKPGPGSSPKPGPPPSRPTPSRPTPVAPAAPSTPAARGGPEPAVAREPERVREPAAERAPEPAPEPAPAPTPPPAARSKGAEPGRSSGGELGRNRRTSETRRKRAARSTRKGAVPSWDDILFGNSRAKD